MDKLDPYVLSKVREAFVLKDEFNFSIALSQLPSLRDDLCAILAYHIQEVHKSPDLERYGPPFLSIVADGVGYKLEFYVSKENAQLVFTVKKDAQGITIPTGATKRDQLYPNGATSYDVPIPTATSPNKSAVAFFDGLSRLGDIKDMWIFHANTQVMYRRNDNNTYVASYGDPFIQVYHKYILDCFEELRPPKKGGRCKNRVLHSRT